MDEECARKKTCIVAPAAKFPHTFCFFVFFNQRGRFLEHEKLSFAIGGARVRILPDKLPGISNHINSREKLEGQAQKADEWQQGLIT